MQLQAHENGHMSSGGQHGCVNNHFTSFGKQEDSQGDVQSSSGPVLEKQHEQEDDLQKYFEHTKVIVRFG